MYVDATFKRELNPNLTTLFSEHKAQNGTFSR
jgi:hypothetical protein